MTSLEAVSSRITAILNDGLLAEKQLTANVLTSHPFADAARCNIDSTIANLLASTQDALLHLRRSRNTLASITRLPPEILLHIFFACRDLCASTSPDAWVALTQVCHQWRQVALGAPLLWNRIDLLNARSRLRAQQRAALVPLTIRSDLVASGIVSSAQSFFADNLARTHHATLSLRPRQMEQLIPALSAPAPIIASLELHMELPMGSRTTYELPDALFDGRAPKLSSLALHGCRFAEGSRHFYGLTQLALSQSPSASRMSTQGLMDLLLNNSGLASLSLEHILPAFAAQGLEDMEADVSINMPALRSLRVTDAVESCTALLSLLILPPDASISCTTTTGLSALDHLLSALNSHYMRGKPLLAFGLFDGKDAQGSLRIHGWLSGTFAALRANPALSLSLQTDVKLAPMLALRAFGSGLETFVAERAMDVQDWLLLISQLRGVQTLRVSDAAGRGLIGALELPTGEGLEPLLASLHTLDISLESSSMLPSRLRPWKEAHGKAGSTLRRLLVRESAASVTPDVADALDALAETVEHLPLSCL